MTAFADLAQATAWVFDLQKFGIKFGLSSTLSLLARLRLDYQKGRYIHIAGTNGKGSVAAMLSAILSRAGYPVGLFTSPHLVSFTERFRLGDEEISEERLLALINEVRAAVDDAEPPTFFEFATAMAFLYFLQSGAAPIILETGMGGRLDATNIVQPLVSVITNISRDHQEHLGEGLLAIAGEKAGIIKPGAPLVTYARQKQVLELFRHRCREAGAPLYQGGIDFKTRGKSGGSFDYFGLQHHIPGLNLSLRGRHQYGNAAVALAVVELLSRDGFPVPEAAIREGLATARWPGRLEVVAQDPRVLLDGAHNPAAALTLAQNLKQVQQPRPPHPGDGSHGRQGRGHHPGPAPAPGPDGHLYPTAILPGRHPPGPGPAGPTLRPGNPPDPPGGRGGPTGPVPGRPRRPYRGHRLFVYGGGGEGVF